MLPFKLVYHPKYDLNLGDHIFPAQKYHMIHDRLLLDRFAEHKNIIEPDLAPDEDVLLVHTKGWVERLKNRTLNFYDILKLEIPPIAIFPTAMRRARSPSTGSRPKRKMGFAQESDQVPV